MKNGKKGWGLIGASDIAKTRMIEAINGRPDSSVVAVMSTSEERAKRYAVKLFLSHWFEEAYRTHYGTEPPKPYPIARLGHAHQVGGPTS